MTCKTFLLILFTVFIILNVFVVRSTAAPTTISSTNVDFSEQSSVESRIKNVTLKLDSLNKQVIESLAEEVVRDATEIPVGNVVGTVLTYRESSGEPVVEERQQPSSSSSSSSSSTTSSPSSPSPSSSSPSSNSTTSQAQIQQQEQDRKFSSVLRELKDLEDHLQVAIRNFTQTRQYAYGAMLRPMLTNIQQLRTNLTMLRNRMIGFVALTEIRQQVNHLTDEIGDAIVAVTEKPAPHLNNISDDFLVTEDAVKPLQESLAWVTE